MKKLIGIISALLCATAFAQYTPPSQPTAQSTAPYWAAGKTSALAATGASGNIALSVTTSAAASQIQIFNSGTTIAFVKFCLTSTCAASVGSAGTSTSDYPVAPGAVVVVSPPAGSTYVAAILSSGTGTIYFTPGFGV